MNAAPPARRARHSPASGPDTHAFAGTTCFPLRTGSCSSSHGLQLSAREAQLAVPTPTTRPHVEYRAATPEWYNEVVQRCAGPDSAQKDDRENYLLAVTFYKG